MNNVDVLLIDESKLDSSFQIQSFFIKGYNKPIPLDVSGMSKGLLAFTKSHLPTR